MTMKVDTYAPDLAVQIMGKLFGSDPKVIGANRTFDVISVSVTDTIDRIDSFTLAVREHSPEPARFAGGGKLFWLDDPLFEEANEVSIEMGYVNNRAFKFLGEITNLAASFPESGAPTLTVSGSSLQNRLQRHRADQPFTNVTDSQIAQKIADSAHLATNIEQTDITYPMVSPNNAHLQEFLRRRAERIGYEFFVKGKTLHFHKPGYIKKLSPAMTLEWGRNLLSFNFNLSTHNLHTQTIVQGSATAHGGDKTELVGKVTAGNESVKMGDISGSELAQDRFKDTTTMTDDHDVTNPKDAQVRAQADHDAKALNFIKANGACMGNPQLVAGIVLQISGIGKRYSGPYYVVSTTHTIDANGYRTTFEVKRNARNATS